MRIGIMVHSDTGNTMQVAETLSRKLIAASHQTMIERLEAVGNPKPGDADSTPASIPGVADFDGLVFAAPVHAFQLSALMRRTIEGIGSLEEKPVVVLVTQGLPMKWMGGNNALRKMARLAKKKGAKVKGSGSVNWPKREQQIEPLTDRLASLF